MTDHHMTDAPDEACAQCRLLSTAWHDLARHPAIVPPDWKPGNGQSYAEAVLAHLNSLHGEDDRPWMPLGQDDPLNAGDEVRHDHVGVTTTAVVASVDDEGDPFTAENHLIGLRNYGTWHVRRAIPELPTEDGAVIVPADGCEHIETNEGIANALVHLGGKWYGGAFQITPEQITTGTWKVARND